MKQLDYYETLPIQQQSPWQPHQLPGGLYMLYFHGSGYNSIQAYSSII